jgi:hypothetical protein
LSTCPQQLEVTFPLSPYIQPIPRQTTRNNTYLLRVTKHFFPNLYSQLRRQLRQQYTLFLLHRTSLLPSPTAIDRYIPLPTSKPSNTSIVFDVTQCLISYLLLFFLLFCQIFAAQAETAMPVTTPRWVFTCFHPGADCAGSVPGVDCGLFDAW